MQGRRARRNLRQLTPFTRPPRLGTRSVRAIPSADWSSQPGGGPNIAADGADHDLAGSIVESAGPNHGSDGWIIESASLIVDTVGSIVESAGSIGVSVSPIVDSVNVIVDLVGRIVALADSIVDAAGSIVDLAGNFAALDKPIFAADPIAVVSGYRDGVRGRSSSARSHAPRVAAAS